MPVLEASLEVAPEAKGMDERAQEEQLVREEFLAPCRPGSRVSREREASSAG